MANIEFLEAIHSWLFHASIIAGVITVILGSGARICTHKIKKMNKKQTTTVGTLATSEKPVFPDMLTVLLGSNSSIAKAEYIDGIATIRAYKGIDVVFEDRNIKVSAKAISTDGSATAELVKNEWESNPNARFKRNYDNSALEIIYNHVPVLQIILLDTNTLRLNGLFLVDSYIHGFSENGFIKDSIDKLRTNPSRFVEFLKNESLLFKYPSEKHLGERSAYFQNMMTQRQAMRDKMERITHRLSKLTDGELKQEALSLTQRMREFEKKMQQDNMDSNERTMEILTALDKMSQEEAHQHDQLMYELIHSNDKLLGGYDKHFKAEAVAIQGEILSRFPEDKRPKSLPAGVYIINNKLGYMSVLDDLDKLANCLEINEKNPQRND